MDFIPDDKGDLQLPYFEDAKNEIGVVGYSSQRSEAQLKTLIKTSMGYLGGNIVSFQSGKFGERYGYRIEFNYHGASGRIDIAALPIRDETNSRVSQAKRHALYSVWKKLESQFNSLLVMPGDVPLVPYMLNERGQTMLEWMRDQGKLPALPEPDDDVVDGEFSEI
jgi:hypothetical protein